MAENIKRCETILVNELLAFVQNKLGSIDYNSLEQICSTIYTETYIYAAKQYLLDTANPKYVKLMTRQREGGAKRSLQDIVRVFSEEDPDDIPTFVARDLNKLRPVTFDHVDVTSLLTDIMLLKAEISKNNGKLEASERVSDELRSELTSLRGNSAASASPPAACNLNMRRGGGGGAVQSDTSLLSTPPNDATNTVGPRVDDPAASWARATSATSTPPKLPRNEPPSAPCPPPADPRTQKDTAARKPRSHRNWKQKPLQEKASQVTTVTTAPKVVADKDGFILVEKKHRKSRNQRGFLLHIHSADASCERGELLQTMARRFLGK